MRSLSDHLANPTVSVKQSLKAKPDPHSPGIKKAMVSARLPNLARMLFPISTTNQFLPYFINNENRKIVIGKSNKPKTFHILRDVFRDVTDTHALGAALMFNVTSVRSSLRAARLVPLILDFDHPLDATAYQDVFKSLAPLIKQRQMAIEASISLKPGKFHLIFLVALPQYMTSQEFSWDLKHEKSFDVPFQRSGGRVPVMKLAGTNTNAIEMFRPGFNAYVALTGFFPRISTKLALVAKDPASTAFPEAIKFLLPQFKKLLKTTSTPGIRPVNPIDLLEAFASSEVLAPAVEYITYLNGFKSPTVSKATTKSIKESITTRPVKPMVSIEQLALDRRIPVIPLNIWLKYIPIDPQSPEYNDFVPRISPEGTIMDHRQYWLSCLLIIYAAHPDLLDNQTKLDAVVEWCKKDLPENVADDPENDIVTCLSSADPQASKGYTERSYTWYFKNLFPPPYSKQYKRLKNGTIRVKPSVDNMLYWFKILKISVRPDRICQIPLLVSEYPEVQAVLDGDRDSTQLDIFNRQTDSRAERAIDSLCALVEGLYDIQEPVRDAVTRAYKSLSSRFVSYDDPKNPCFFVEYLRKRVPQDFTPAEAATYVREEIAKIYTVDENRLYNPTLGSGRMPKEIGLELLARTHIGALRSLHLNMKEIKAQLMGAPITILIGDPSIGKTSHLPLMYPYYPMPLLSSDMDFTRKDATNSVEWGDRISRYLIMVLDEVDTILKTRGVAKVLSKHLLSGNAQFRPLYKGSTITVTARAKFIGSTNVNFLSIPELYEGSARRFWIIPLKDINKEYLESDKFSPWTFMWACAQASLIHGTDKRHLTWTAEKENDPEIYQHVAGVLDAVSTKSLFALWLDQQFNFSQSSQQHWEWWQEHFLAITKILNDHIPMNVSQWRRFLTDDCPIFARMDKHIIIPFQMVNSSWFEENMTTTEARALVREKAKARNASFLNPKPTGLSQLGVHDSMKLTFDSQSKIDLIQGIKPLLVFPSADNLLRRIENVNKRAEVYDYLKKYKFPGQLRDKADYSPFSPEQKV